jgi:hypothetical protein
MMNDKVLPMVHVCRDCTPTIKCSECVWLGKLLHQEVTLSQISDNILEVE